MRRARGALRRVPRGADDERGGARGACLSRLMEAHGAAVADLFEGGEPFAGVVLRAAIAGALAAPRPDFARLVEGPVVALRLAMRQDARDAVDALIKAAAAEDARARELAGLIWAAFLAGCEPRLRLALPAAPGERRGRRLVERAVLGGCTGCDSFSCYACEPARRWRLDTTYGEFLAHGRPTHQSRAGRGWGEGPPGSGRGPGRRIRRAAPRGSTARRSRIDFFAKAPRKHCTPRPTPRSTASASRRRGPSSLPA